MTILHTSKPIVDSFDIDAPLPHVRANALLKDIERHFKDHIHIDKPRFIRLVNCIVEMRFDNAFAILDDVSNGMVILSECRKRHLNYLLSRHFGGGAAPTPAITPTEEPKP